jgi:phospholipid/cholesterol/gamma-HCH transport system substrate-binding protein
MSNRGNLAKNIFDPVPARTREHPLRNGFLLLALIGLAIYMALSHNIPLINGKPGYGLKADFRSVNQVSTQTPVRVHGVDVGIVDGIDPGPDPRRSSRISMRITDDGVTVHNDARAEIRWRTVLGGRMYIDLEPGSPRAPKLPDNGVIPIANTNNQAELDDVLQVYDGGTEQAQRDIFKGLGQGFSDPTTTKSAVAALPDLKTAGEGITPYLGTETGDLHKLVAATAVTVQALGTDTTKLQNFVAGARQTLQAPAVRRAELGQFLELSPSTLDSTRDTMNRIRTTLDHLDPLVTNLRPGVRELAPATNAAEPALRSAQSLLSEIRPLLTDLRPTFADLATVGDAGTPVLNGLKPTLRRVSGEIVPWLNETDPVTKIKNYTSVGGALSTLNNMAAEFDKIGFRLHVSTPAANNSVISLYIIQLQRSCEKAATNVIQRAACPALAKGMAYGQLGRPTEKTK